MADSNSAEDDEKRRQNQINFIVEQQARIDANLESVTLRLDQLTERDEVLTERQDQLTAGVAALVAGVEVFRDEVRYAIDNLIIANEVTRDLTQQTSRRVSDLENK
jgi:hypothetical protein